MSRVTPAEVKAIVETTLTDPVIQVWIDAAGSIVTKNADCIGGTEELLTQVELNLSAHLITISSAATRGVVTKEKLGPLETEYSSGMVIKNSVESTPYGIAANMLAGGCLTDYEKTTAKIGLRHGV